MAQHKVVGGDIHKLCVQPNVLVSLLDPADIAKKPSIADYPIYAVWHLVAEFCDGFAVAEIDIVILDVGMIHALADIALS